jgi:hypothetical protein
MGVCSGTPKSRCWVRPTIRNVVLHPSLRIDLQLSRVHWPTEAGVELPGILTVRIAYETSVRDPSGVLGAWWEYAISENSRPSPLRILCRPVAETLNTAADSAPLGLSMCSVGR